MLQLLILQRSLIDIAKKRAIKEKLKINYKVGDIESIKSKKIKFDIIISLEVIEHVENYKTFLKAIFSCLIKNGLIILSTINRSYFSYISTILFAEKILKIVPPSEHMTGKNILNQRKLKNLLMNMVFF